MAMKHLSSKETLPTIKISAPVLGLPRCTQIPIFSFQGPNRAVQFSLKFQMPPALPSIITYHGDACFCLDALAAIFSCTAV